MKYINNISILVLTFLGSIAPAAVQCNQFEIVLYDRVWQVTSYYVQDDIVSNPVRDFQILEPDGIAYKTGILYVSGDREEWCSGARLAIYTWQNNALAYSGYKQMPSTSPSWWGSDGITFNTSGDLASYGGGTSDLVSVETDIPPQTGIISISTGAVTGKKTLIAAQDVSYVASIGKFAVLSTGIDNSSVTIYDKTITIQEYSFPIAASAYGLAWVSRSFGQWFCGQAVIGNGFLVAAISSPTNELIMYDLEGTQVGVIQQLPISPKARIPFDSGIYMLEPAFGQIEAITVDEASNTIFIGDHGSAMIHALRPIRLAGDINKSGTVDFLDVAAFISNWLLSDCVDPLWCNGADIQHSGKVDFHDFSVISRQLGETP